MRLRVQCWQGQKKSLLQCITPGECLARACTRHGLLQLWPTILWMVFRNGLQKQWRYQKNSLRLKNNNRFEIHRVASGTNIFRLVIKGTKGESFVENLKSNGIIARPDNLFPDGLILQVNESLLGTNAAELEKIFIKSLNA